MATPWKEIRQMKMSDVDYEPIRKQVAQEVAELIWAQFCHMWSANDLKRDFNILQLEHMHPTDLSPRMGFSKVTCYIDDSDVRNRAFVAVTAVGDTAAKLYCVGSLPTVEQQAELSSCTYCQAMCACPKCWGRAAIEKLKMKQHSFVDDLTTILSGGKLDDTTRDLVNGLIARYEVK